MCWFVTIAVDPRSRNVIERALAERGILTLEWVESTPTTNVFPAGVSCAQITDGSCSCALYSKPAEPGRLEGELAAERRRLEKKRWSSSKIDRAISAKAESAARPSRFTEAADAFKALTAYLVGELGAVQVFAHFYSGNQHREAVGLPERSSVSLHQFLVTGFPPNQVVTIYAAAG